MNKFYTPEEPPLSSKPVQAFVLGINRALQPIVAYYFENHKGSGWFTYDRYEDRYYPITDIIKWTPIEYPTT